MMKTDRRTLVKGLAIATGIGMCGVGVTFLARRSEAHALLRPPGALEEKDFLASCIKCGQCIQVCPFGSIRLLDLSAGIHTATPVINPAERGCYLCDLFPCILCCPSGALDDKVEKIEEVSMGIAYITNPEKCLRVRNVPLQASNVDRVVEHGNRTELEQELNAKLKKEVGKDCTLCLIVCKVPDRDNAIRLSGNTPVIGRSCVGCGACVEVCPEELLHVEPAVDYDAFYGRKESQP